MECPMKPYVRTISVFVRTWVLVAACGVAAPALADTQALCGPKDHETSIKPAGRLFNHVYRVMVLGPHNRACDLERRAKLEYTEITDEQRAQTRPGHLLAIVRTVPPKQASDGIVVPPPITQVVLRTSEGQIIKPIDLVPVPQEWGNAMGGKITTQGADAWFDVVPDGPFDVLVINADREARAEFKGQDRAKVR